MENQELNIILNSLIEDNKALKSDQKKIHEAIKNLSTPNAENTAVTKHKILHDYEKTIAAKFFDINHLSLQIKSKLEDNLNLNYQNSKVLRSLQSEQSNFWGQFDRRYPLKSLWGQYIIFTAGILLVLSIVLGCLLYKEEQKTKDQQYRLMFFRRVNEERYDKLMTEYESNIERYQKALDEPNKE